MNIDLKSAVKYFIIIVVTIITLYYTPSAISSLWLIAMLVLYWFSKDEAFWMAFFLVVTDGFLSFFGLYETRLSLFPGLPAVEVGQFYVMLTLLKARYREPSHTLFFKRFLYVMGIYIVILIVLGFSVGIEGELNAYLRIIKQTLPFLLFYSIPRLMTNSKSYERFFSLIFPVAILASVAQIYEIFNLEPLSATLNAKEFMEENIKEDEAVRSFYNPGIILLTLFGSLFYSTRKDHKFNSVYLNLLTLFAFSMAFLSATRGWIIGFGLCIILYLVFTTGLKPLRIFSFAIIGLALFFILLRIPVVKHQITNAFDRFLSVELVLEGDVTAGETNVRLTERAPKVMKKWKESPVLGYGFSDESRTYGDGHVGNQNILLHSGIIGFSLMMIFFIYFMFKMLTVSIRYHEKSLRVFIIFFIGWFFIHTTSGQHFAYGMIMGYIMVQCIFFCFGAYSVAETEGHLIEDISNKQNV